MIDVALLFWLSGTTPALAGGDPPPAPPATSPPPSPEEVAAILRMRPLLQELDLLQAMEQVEVLPILESQTDEADDDR